MPTRDEAIANALVSTINGGSFSQSVTASRKHVVKSDVADVGTLVCYVVPRSHIAERATRRHWDETYELTVLLQKKLPQTGDDAEIEALKLLAEEIADLIENTSRQGGAALLGIDRDPLFNAAKLIERRVFEAPLTFSYRLEVEPS